MRAFIIAACSALILSVTALPASAEVLFSVSLAVPVAYDLTNHDVSDEDISGFKVLVSLPFFLGFGYEKYDVTGLAGPTSITIDVEFYDLFVTIPVIEVVLGAGIGTGLLDTNPVSNSFEEADLKQFFISYGIDFGLFFDIHLAYHVISGEAAGLGANSNESLDAKMWTAGIKVGF